jgi:hypothetical protein
MDAGITGIRGRAGCPGGARGGELGDIEGFVFFLQSRERAKVEVRSLDEGEEEEEERPDHDSRILVISV